MAHPKHYFLIFNIIAIASILLGCAIYSIHLLNEFNKKSDAPFLAIINNNLGVKTKVMSLQLTLQKHQTNPTNSSLNALKRQFKIIRGSINNDLASDVTKKFHTEHGNTDKLIKFQEYFDQLAFTLPRHPDDQEAVEKSNKLLNSAYRLWNRYSRKVIHAAQNQSVEIHNQWNASLKTQIWLMVTIGLTSLIVLIIISRQLFIQRAMSQVLRQQAKELNVARLAAEESTKAKSRFLSNMSHEIRTPLNGIIGLTNLARQKAIKPEVINYLDKVILSSDSLLHVINDILDVNKIESGKLELEITEVNLAEILDCVSANMGAYARDKGLTFEIYIDPNVPAYIQLDQTRVQQVLNNLVSNAIKFTEQGLVTINLAVDDSGKKLVIAVKDTGIGIKQENLNKLFKEFSQADLSTTRKFGGTGLGLAIAKNLTQMMGGEIQINSTYAVGTTFKVTFPLSHQTPPLFNTETQHSKPIHVVSLNNGDVFDLTVFLEATNFIVTDIRQCTILLILLPPTTDEDNLSKAASLLEYNTDKEIYVLGYPDQLSHLLSLSKVSFFGIEAPLNSAHLINLIDLNKEETIESDTPIANKSFTGSKVLLVEDNPINQLIAQEMLTLLDIQVTLAENGKIAVEKSNDQAFDLILMDIQMPEMDGLEATRRILNAGMNVNTPIIALTANVMQEDVRLYQETGMASHLPKPFKPESLLETLELFLKTPKA